MEAKEFFKKSTNHLPDSILHVYSDLIIKIMEEYADHKKAESISDSLYSGNLVDENDSDTIMGNHFRPEF